MLFQVSEHVGLGAVPLNHQPQSLQGSLDARNTINLLSGLKSEEGSELQGCGHLPTGPHPHLQDHLLLLQQEHTQEVLEGLGGDKWQCRTHVLMVIGS